MERIPVQSSNLDSIGYDEHTLTLEVAFKRKGGGVTVYQYSNVPHRIWAGFLHSPSKGTYFAAEVKNHADYPSTKIQ